MPQIRGVYYTIDINISIHPNMKILIKLNYSRRRKTNIDLQFVFFSAIFVEKAFLFEFFT